MDVHLAPIRKHSSAKLLRRVGSTVRKTPCKRHFPCGKNANARELKFWRPLISRKLLWHAARAVPLPSNPCENSLTKRSNAVALVWTPSNAPAADGAPPRPGGRN